MPSRATEGPDDGGCPRGTHQWWRRVRPGPLRPGHREVKVNLGQGTAQGEGADALTGIEGVVGGPKKDDLTGDGKANTLVGLGGDDRLFSLGKPDVLFGKPGADDLFGGGGNGSLSGGPGNDTCKVGPGGGTTSSC